MSRTRRTHPSCPLFALALSTLLLSAGMLSAQAPKPTVPVSAYAKWESLGYGALSPRGGWLATPIRLGDGDAVLRLHKVGSDSVVSIENGGHFEFSKDGRWVAYAIGVSSKTRERLRKERKPVHESMGLLDLSRGDTTLVPEVSSFAFSGDGRWLAFRRYADKGAKGSDLVVRRLSDGRDAPFGGVTSFSWSDRGAHLALTVAGRSGVGAAVELYLPGSGTLRSLASGAPSYTGLSWRKKADDLAALAAVRDSGWADTTHMVLAWRDVSRSRSARIELDPATMKGFPDSTRIVATRDPRWSDDGARIFFGIKAREAKEAPEAKKEERVDTTAADSAQGGHARAGDGRHEARPDTSKPGLEIWNAKDVDIIPSQKVRAKRDEQRSDLAVWTLSGNRFARLSDGPDEQPVLDAHGHTVVVLDGKPYRQERMFGPSENDVYVVNPETGARNRIATDVQYFQGMSPDGRYVLWVDSANYFAHDVRRDRTVDLTKGLGPSFVNDEDDHPIVE